MAVHKDPFLRSSDRVLAYYQRPQSIKGVCWCLLHPLLRLATVQPVLSDRLAHSTQTLAKVSRTKMDECLAGTVFACCGSVVAIVQYTFCSTRACGGDATCCDNCCRCNCCWPNGALPVEDYPIGPNGVPDKPAEQTVDSHRDTNADDATQPPPAYKPTPQMSVGSGTAPPPTA